MPFMPYDEWGQAAPDPYWTPPSSTSPPHRRRETDRWLSFDLRDDQRARRDARDSNRRTFPSPPRPPQQSKRPLTPESLPEQPQKRYRCDPCDKGFTTKRALARHRRENDRHRVGPQASFGEYQCRACSSRFVRAYDCERHYEEQHGNGKVACERCGKRVRPNAPHRDASGRSCGRRVDHPDSARPQRDEDSYEKVCEGLCHLSVKAQEVPPCIYRSETRMATERRTIPCGICHWEFEIHDPQALFDHLNEHFAAMQKGRYRCDICEINFCYKADLNRHLQSAARGDCGFGFVHRKVCTGHHPPGRLQTLDQTLHPQVYHDDDRFSLAYRISHWEYSQLLAFIRSIEDLKEQAQMQPFDGRRHTHMSASAAMQCRDCTSCDVRRFCDKYLRPSCRPGSVRAPDQGCDRTCNLSGLAPLAADMSACLQAASYSRRSVRPARSFTEGSLSYSHRERCDKRWVSSPNVGLGNATTRLRELLRQYPVDTSVYRNTWNAVLMRATMAGDVRLAQVALSQGADIDAEDQNHWTALQLAAASGTPDMVELLLLNGADPNHAKDKQHAPIKLTGWYEGPGGRGKRGLAMERSCELDADECARLLSAYGARGR